MLNHKLWNQEQYEKNFYLYPEVRRLPQSKGRCKMTTLPQRGDLVSFVLKGTVIMKGYIDSDGFETGTSHKIHSCNVGDIRLHTVPDEFIWVHITQVGLSQPIRNTGQRTWAKMPDL